MLEAALSAGSRLTTGRDEDEEPVIMDEDARSELVVEGCRVFPEIQGKDLVWGKYEIGTMTVQTFLAPSFFLVGVHSALRDVLPEEDAK